MADNVFLTFDDGPTIGTEEVLDVLKSSTAPSTFFLTGRNVIAAGGKEKQKALTKRMQAEGHGLGNHCLVHKPSTKAGYKAAYGDLTDPAKKAAFRKNYDDNLAYFRGLLGDPKLELKLARLPGDGRFVQVCVAETNALGMKHIGWDFEFAPNGTMGHIDKNDWQGVTGVSCTFETLPPNNNVLLLHDSHWSGKAALLTALLKKLTDNGRVFKVLPS